MLSKRLETIAFLVNKDAILLDIGCDHGYLGVYLLKNNHVRYVYGGDVALGPLENVKNNIRRNLLNNKMEAVLSNGLETFIDVKFTDIVIAGMGGSLIVDIIKDYHYLLKDKNIILQPNINSYKVRKHLIENGFNIVQESIIKDNDIIYEIICAQTANVDKYSYLELSYGKSNIEQRNILTIELMKEKLSKYNKILSNINEDNDKYQYFLNHITLIKEYLNEN